MCVSCCDNTGEKKLRYDFRGSRSIFKFNYNSYKHFRTLVSFVWRLLRSDKTKVFLKCLASFSFEFPATLEIRKLFTIFKVHFFIDRSALIFNKDFVFGACTRLLMLKIMLCKTKDPFKVWSFIRKLDVGMPLKK